jgi:hypothetical protein
MGHMQKIDIAVLPADLKLKVMSLNRSKKKLAKYQTVNDGTKSQTCSVSSTLKFAQCLQVAHENPIQMNYLKESVSNIQDLVQAGSCSLEVLHILSNSWLT